MKQSIIIFLILFSLVITLFTTCIDARSAYSLKLRGGKGAYFGQHMNDFNNRSTQGGKVHATYKRSSVLLGDSGNTNAIMTLNSFEKGGDGGGPSECDDQYHSNNFLIVALSTQWYNHGQRCLNYINIYYNGISVRAQVVDECDSDRGCPDNIVDASYAVWVALQVSPSDWGKTKITWSDA